MPTQATTLVTGATGFLGADLTRRLLNDGHNVRILARSQTKAKQFMERGAEVVNGDITDDGAVQAAVEGVTTIYHLVGKLFIPGVPADEYQRIHVEGTRRILAHSAKQRTLKRFVHCSTTGVLGVTGDRPANEEAPYAPTNAYESTKLAAELLVRETWASGFPASIVRPGLVYGPGDIHLLGFFQSVQRGLFRPIGRRPVWLHPVYIDDMTEAIIRCGVDDHAVGECFHIAGSQPATLRQLARTIAATVEAPEPRGWIPRPLASAVALAGDALPGAIRAYAPLTTSRLDFLTHSRVYDVSKAHRLLQFSADTPLRDGIARTAEWYSREGYLILRKR